MSRVRPEGIDQFHERLEAFKRSSKASLSIKDVIAKSMRKIEEARSYGATWDNVAELLSESFQTEQQGGLQVTGKTVQGYYSKILKERQKAKESSSRAARAGTRGKVNSKPKPIEYESGQLDAEREQCIISNSNGLNIQSTAEDLSLTGSPTSGKSQFNFNTVRPTS